MKTIEPRKPRAWELALPVILGITAWVGIAAVMPGASCRDGSPSSAVGRRGACSHHGGVQRGWGWVGILPALLVWGCVSNLLESRRSRGTERQPAQVLAGPMIEPPRKLADPLPTDMVQALRAAIGIGADVSFTYSEDDGYLPARVFPRWIQMADPHGLRTLCVMADCRATGALRAYALDRIRMLNVIEQGDTPVQA